MHILCFQTFRYVVANCNEVVKTKDNFYFSDYLIDRCSLGAETMSGGVLGSLSLEINEVIKFFTA